MERVETSERPAPHPIVWTLLYLPFGAMSGFVGVALIFLATKHGLSITEGALLGGANLLTQWMKWIWAPVIDITLSPKRWYVISTAFSALGVFLMSAVPLSPSTLALLLGIIALSSLINSIVGMAVESLIASSTKPDDAGRVSAWFQVGNLGGGALGGALGLHLLEHMPAPWMAGAIMAVLFMTCCFALRWTVDPAHHGREGGPRAAVKSVVLDLWAMLKTKGGLLSAILCVLPIGTGAAQSVLTQAAVAEHWHAGSDEVKLVQGVFASVLITAGCFVGGWICQRFHPRAAYSGISFGMALVTVAMANTPATVTMYIGFSLAYSFTIGMSYVAFTAFVLNVMGKGAAATKYNIYASLSNFPIWWLGLLLGYVADHRGPSFMLMTESACGVMGLLIFGGATMLVRRTRLAEELAPLAPAPLLVNHEVGVENNIP